MFLYRAEHPAPVAPVIRAQGIRAERVVAADAIARAAAINAVARAIAPDVIIAAVAAMETLAAMEGMDVATVHVNNMPPTTPTKLQTRHHPLLIVAGIGITAIVLLGLTYFYFEQRQEREALESAAQATEDALAKGDFAVAQAESARLLEDGVSGFTRSIAYSTLAASQFLSSNPDDRMRAIETIKAQVRESTNNFEKAYAVNQLLGYLYGSAPASAYTAVFTGEPFQSLRVEGDMGQSLRNLAQYSLSLSPTFFGEIYSAYYDANKLLAAPTINASSTIASITASINRAQKLHDEQRSFVGGPLAPIMQDFVYYAALGHLYGALFAAQPSYAPVAEQSYEHARTIYTNAAREGGSQFNAVAVWVPFVTIKEAMLIHNASRGARDADAQIILDEMLDLINDNQTLHQGVFGAYVEALHAAAKTDNARMRLVRLSKISPKFKEFLNAHGWNL